MDNDEEYDSIDLEELQKTSKVVSKNCVESIRESMKNLSRVSKAFDLQIESSISSQFIDCFKDSIVPSELMNSFGNLVKVNQDIVDTIQNSRLFFKFKIPEELIKKSRRFHAINILNNIGWPFFIHLSQEDVDFINKLEFNDQKEKKIGEYIYRKCNADYLNEIVSGWNDNGFIKDDRKQLLSQAIKCYENELYASCVALLTCQMDGLISDMYNYTKKKEITVDNEIFYDNCSDINPNGNKKPSEGQIDHSEKYQLLYVSTIYKETAYLWMTCIDYIFNIIYTSDNKITNGNQPYRNKICHGIQTDFNTKEHALKSILVTDIIIKLSEAIDEEINKEDYSMS